VALKDHSHVQVVGSASNGKIALEKGSALAADLFILDLEMPVMDGLETLREIQRKNLPFKVILFSGSSLSSANKTFEAMKLGALDFVAKLIADEKKITPEKRIRESLLPKIESLFKLPSINLDINVPQRTPLEWDNFLPKVLVIASSTGGPQALEDFFLHLQAPLPFPVLIAQHMPPVFTTSFAKRLSDVSKRVCREAKTGEALEPNHVYIAPGDFYMTIKCTSQGPVIALDQRDQRNYVRPCADFLFETAAECFGAHTLGIVFTGMGRDGADGARVIKRRGGAVLIQDEKSCAVFGMPGAVSSEQNFDLCGSPAELALHIQAITKKMRLDHVA
jgi:two-component system chemotaxis response regulator CheB